jgi:mRNA interferase YafQ
MLKADFTNQFKRDYRLAEKRGWNIALLDGIIRELIDETPLPAKNRDHPLTGNHSRSRECHIKPDWLLIYQTGNGAIVFERTGTHSDLLEK